MKVGKFELNPTKIVCLGRNYLDHIRETDASIPKEPIFFIKTINTLITNNEPIVFPKILYESKEYNRVDHEVELAFIIKRKCKNLPANHAYENILGYTIFLDLTARAMQIKDRNVNLPWYRSKNFDCFGPIGPVIIPQTEIGDPHNLKIELKVNGEIKQSSNTKYMIYKIPEILEYISKFLTLEKDDIIATGTPSGISAIQPGDVIEASIEKIGVIRHQIILE